MPWFRFSIAGLMGVVLVAAIGVAALRDASVTWAGVMFLLTCGLLALAVVGLVCRGNSERAWWLGVCLFGWGYVKLAFFTRFYAQPGMATTSLIKALGQQLGLLHGQFVDVDGLRVPARSLFYHVGHCVFALLAAVLGGLVARAIFGRERGRTLNAAAEPPPAGALSGRPWLRPTIVGVAGSAAGDVGCARRAERARPLALGGRHVFAHVGTPGAGGPGRTPGPRELPGDLPGRNALWRRLHVAGL